MTGVEHFAPTAHRLIDQLRPKETEMTTDQTQPLVDALRARIADPGAFLPRIADTANSGETGGGWAARAISAGLADGSLGVNICSALCADVERDRDDYEDQLGDMRAALSAAEAEVDQLRYERRLLGASRLVLDKVGDSLRLAPSEMEKLRNEAAIVAQRIVDEIGHPVTDEPALGPELREQVSDLRERLKATSDACNDARNRLHAAHAAGYAEAVARLRDDARYRDWWTSNGVTPDGPIRRHLADYLEGVGPDGVDVTTGRWPARELHA